MKTTWEQWHNYHARPVTPSSLRKNKKRKRVCLKCVPSSPYRTNFSYAAAWTEQCIPGLPPIQRAHLHSVWSDSSHGTPLVILSDFRVWSFPHPDQVFHLDYGDPLLKPRGDEFKVKDQNLINIMTLSVLWLKRYRLLTHHTSFWPNLRPPRQTDRPTCSPLLTTCVAVVNPSKLLWRAGYWCMLNTQSTGYVGLNGKYAYKVVDISFTMTASANLCPWIV